MVWLCSRSTLGIPKPSAISGAQVSMPAISFVLIRSGGSAWKSSPVKRRSSVVDGSSPLRKTIAQVRTEASNTPSRAAQRVSRVPRFVRDLSRPFGVGGGKDAGRLHQTEPSTV